MVQGTAVIFKHTHTYTHLIQQFQNEVISTSPVTAMALNFHNLSLTHPILATPLTVSTFSHFSFFVVLESKPRAL